jgi:hypothetical protein
MGASMAFPSTSPADELSDKKEFAEASSSSFATSGAAEASAGWVIWWRTRTSKRTIRRLVEFTPKLAGNMKHIDPISR